MALVLNPNPVSNTTAMTTLDHYHPLQQHDVQNNNKMNVFFRFIDGKTLCLWLDPTVDIQTVKKELLLARRIHNHKKLTNDNHEDLPVVVHHHDINLVPNDIFLIWNGKPLRDDWILQDYSLAENATIMVSVRNKGGCFMISLSILATICMALIGSTCTCGLSLFIIPLLLPFLLILPLCCL